MVFASICEHANSVFIFASTRGCQIFPCEQEALQTHTDGEQRALQTHTDGVQRALQTLTDGKQQALQKHIDGKQRALQILRKFSAS